MFDDDLGITVHRLSTTVSTTAAATSSNIFAFKDCKKPIKVAVMGCIVNGPGEAKEADIGIAGGDGCGLIFKKGEILRKVDEKDLLDELMKEIDKL